MEKERKDSRRKLFIRKVADKVSGARLRTRMFFLYIVGGVIPMVLIALYLIWGTNQILVDRAEKTEMVELELLGSETKEFLNSISTASRNFYFDSLLEEIATKEYEDYGELVKDYRQYTQFDEFGNSYNRLTAWIQIYLDNETIVENAHFSKADKEVKGQQWYQKVIALRGGEVWQYRPLPLALDKSNTLVLTRLLRTKKGQDVGVLAIYLRKERLREQVEGRESHTRIILNGEEEIISSGEGVALSYIKPVLEKYKDNGNFQKNVKVEGKEYVLTCYSMKIGESEDILQIISMKSYHDILAKANQQSRTSFLVFMASVLISISIILVYSWSFDSRVNRFLKQMEKAASGNFDLEPSLGGNDEISDLYGYLGTMIGDIQRLLAEIYQERLHAEQLKTKQREAEFKALASQINPHFLYNTLETIRMKARVNKEKEIEDLVKMLAKILRKNIRAGNEEVTINEEVEMVEAYLKIQKYRFEERIQYQIAVEESTKNLSILPLILQPVVENSIIHGLETKEETGHIIINIRQDKDEIVIIVEDDGKGIEPERLLEIQKEMNRRNLNRPHIGTSNVHQRIQLKYGERYGLSITSIPGKMTKVAMRLPVRSNAIS